MRLVIIAGLLLLSIQTCLAEQLAYSKQSVDEGVKYYYKWLDGSGDDHEMSFVLDRDKLAAAPTEQKNYRPTLAQRYVTVELLKTARKIDPRDARVDIRQRGEEIEIEVVSRSDEKNKVVHQQLSEAREIAFSNYLSEHYYTRYRTPFNQQAIKPDHVRYIEEFTNTLIPLSQAIYERILQRSDAREYFNLLLSWVQSIPYDALQNRAQSNGSGFAPPGQLLSQNKGDCDSKSVLTATISRAFLPDTPMALILLKEHALLGIALTPRKTEQTLTVEGTTYILLEPTGPALLPFGTVADTTAMALAQGQYTVEPIQ